MEKSSFYGILGTKISVENVDKNTGGKAYNAVSKSDGRKTYLLSEESKNLVIIAVIFDPDNETFEYVAAEEGLVMIEPYIRKKTVDNDDLEYICLYEKTCGSIIYKKRNHQRFYLLIENQSGHIGFPKGHMEFGESEEQTAVREVFEETGLTVSVSEKTRQTYSYKTSNGVEKICVYFCSEFEEEEIFLQEGEILRCWLVPYSTALELLNYPQDIEIFKKAAKTND